MASHDTTAVITTNSNGNGKNTQPTPWKVFMRIGAVAGFIVALGTIFVMYQTQVTKAEESAKDQERRMIKLEDKVDSNADKRIMEIKHLEEKVTIKLDTVLDVITDVKRMVERHMRRDSE